MIGKHTFGHVLKRSIWHIVGTPKNSGSITSPTETSKCNSNLFVCSFCSDQKYMQFSGICKKCFKMLSKKEQEELVHYFCVKRLKGE